jgi:YD repeat-containing protein
MGYAMHRKYWLARLIATIFILQTGLSPASYAIQIGTTVNSYIPRQEITCFPVGVKVPSTRKILSLASCVKSGDYASVKTEYSIWRLCTDLGRSILNWMVSTIQSFEVPVAHGTIAIQNLCRSLTDPAGHTTMMHHDLEGRLSSKVYADGTEYSYTYNASGLLQNRTELTPKI